MPRLLIAFVLLGWMAAAASAAAAEPGDACGQTGAGWSERRRVVHLAVCEWARFGFPVVEIQTVTPREADSLPAVLGLAGPLARAAAPPRAGYEAVTPAVEAQVRFGRTESDRSASAAIETYWTAVRPAFVASVRRQREALGRGGGGASLYPGWWDPWSAAFVSWVYQSAGVAGFQGSASHVLYLKAALAQRPRALVPASARRPLPGDLICAPRADARGQPTAVSEQAFLAALRQPGDHFETHCDIVVRVNRASVVSIGGNVKNAVTATVTPLRRGRLVRTDARPWSAILVMAGPYDPCARIESVGVEGWESQDAERRRALARTGCAP